jgi:ElaB/YqjD/DUF883 family membrane-anchored ribosome-binding protein
MFPDHRRQAPEKHVAASGTIVGFGRLFPIYWPLTGRNLMSTTERTGPRSAADDLTARGSTALRDAKAGFDNVVEDVSQKGRDAMRSAREVRDTFADALLDAVRRRPYTTLALAAFVGFAYGAMRRR